MPNRRLTPPEIATLNKLQATTVEALDVMASGDPEFLFALRRRLFTRLMHLERGTPAHRNKLKAGQWQAQQGRCAMCNGPMEQKGSELDRFVAWKGYTTENTRLVHHDCHVADQKRKGFSDVEADIAERLEDLETVATEIETCEIMTDDGWATLDVDEALGLRGAMLRCPACRGRVRAHKAGTTGQRAHFEHLQKHDGCPLKNGYSGESSQHPDPVQGPPTQRDVMRRLYRDYGHDEQAVCAAYVRAEQAGEARRKSGASEMGPEVYARALWKDGIAKGWLRS